jgi:hypothetical protein
MSKIRNSREKWYAERLGIETISRDNGDANIFLTINMDPRAWPDVRNLVYKLENGVDSVMPPDYFEKDTQKFSELLDKYAWQISVYLYRKVKLFFKAFLCDICHVSGDINKQPLPGDDIVNKSWYWARVEFTSSRGIQHWHCLARVPYTLDTGILGRMVHVGRVIREEIKCGNIKSHYLEQASVISILKCISISISIVLIELSGHFYFYFYFSFWMYFYLYFYFSLACISIVFQ